jgi:hypothetical protein
VGLRRVWTEQYVPGPLATLDGRLNRRISSCKDSGPTGSHILWAGNRFHGSAAKSGLAWETDLVFRVSSFFVAVFFCRC